MSNSKASHRWLYNGPLLSVTVLVLAGYTYFFIFDFLKPKIDTAVALNPRQAFWMRLVGLIFLTFMLLNFAALFMTYFVGPGFCSDEFFAEKILLDSKGYVLRTKGNDGMTPEYLDILEREVSSA